MTAPQIVVFDIDGTLMDHDASAGAGLAAWVTTLGHEMSDELAAAWRQAERQHFTAWRDGRITFAEQRRRRLRDVLPLMGEPVGSDPELDEVFVGYLTAYESAWQAYPDVHGCLTALEALGMPLAVLSNGDDAQQRKKLEVIGVADRFACVFTAGNLGVAKPQPEAYLATARELGVSPGACLYVGDDYELDVMAARAAGWQALHLDRAGRRVETAALTTLAELPERLV